MITAQLLKTGSGGTHMCPAGGISRSDFDPMLTDVAREEALDARSSTLGW